MWKSIVELVRNRLMFWEGKHISRCGRVFLIKLVLSFLFIYFLSFFQAPKDIISKLESLFKILLWGGNVEKHKVHWVAWKKVHVYREGRKRFGNKKS
uniref:Ribonuclease H protein At1g65750 family n=2 Tax=Cajanus cajan TaxID=3821 RepID=A0A151UFZ9_CAJCA|nr:Putative ribonuclease H protein At1g65750 family [Cajanus cajan]